MSWGVTELRRVCEDALRKAHQVLINLGSAGVQEIQGERVTDITTRGDITISEVLTSFFKDEGVPAVLYTEESGVIKLVKEPEYVIALDDIDGTNNYHRGGSALQHCTAITVFDSLKPCFSDALIGGVVEHSSRNAWLAVRGRGCYYNNTKVKTSLRTVLDKRTLIVVDHYASGENILKFLRVYGVAWVKDFGSAAFHLAGVSSGLFDAYLSCSQKAHELGAGYLLIKEAGGFLSDLNGAPLDKKKYCFDAKYGVIAASTRELGKALLSRIK